MLNNLNKLGIVALLIMTLFSCKHENNDKYDLYLNPVPITEIPYFPTTVTRSGWEERGPEFTQWNSTGVRVENGSGTLSYYDSEENWIYVISCGHLFPAGIGTADYYKKNPKYKNVDVFYHNEKKLPKYERYRAQVLCHAWQGSIYDVSLLRFKPNWKNPWVTPVAPLNYQMIKGQWYHNVGCDGMTEVAHYLVQFSRANTRQSHEEFICVNNVARGGRSGGGLISPEKYLVGITSRSDRVSTSYYSSFKQIHNFLKLQGYEFVLKDPKNLARRIPIKDRNNEQGHYPDDYIPIPGEK